MDVILPGLHLMPINRWTIPPYCSCWIVFTLSHPCLWASRRYQCNISTVDINIYIMECKNKWIKGFLVHNVLVDTSSAADIIFAKAFRQMQEPDDKVHDATHPLSLQNKPPYSNVYLATYNYMRWMWLGSNACYVLQLISIELQWY
jgi:hypothetical protein